MRGCLSDLPLAELLRLLGQGQATGVLELQPMGYQLWWRAGKMVGAVAPGFSLHQLILERGWSSPSQLQTYLRLFVAEGMKTPFGVWLVNHQGWQWPQIRWLFHEQVVRPVSRLLGVAEAQFVFQAGRALPCFHLTGLSAEPLAVLLAGLRALRDWQALTSQLPEPTVALVRLSPERPPYRLTQLEWRLWESADGQTSLLAIARQWRIPVLELQKVAFRLMVIGLVGELPLLPTDQTAPQEPQEELPQSFLKDLVQSLQHLQASLQGSHK